MRRLEKHFNLDYSVGVQTSKQTKMKILFFFLRSVSVASTFKVWLDQVAVGFRPKRHERKGHFLRL